jgi:hypothetical protein
VCVCVCVCVHPIHSAEYSSSALREESKSCYSIKVRSRETCQCCFIPEILGIDGCRGMGSLLGEDGPFSSYPAGPLWNSLSRHTKLGGDTNVISFFFPFFFLILFLCYPPCLQFSTVSCMRIYKFFLYVGSESRCPSFVVDISSRNRFALYKCERGGRPAPSSSWLIVHTVSMPYSSVVYVSLFLIGSSHFESEMAGTTMCPWFWEWFCFFVLFNQ